MATEAINARPGFCPLCHLPYVGDWGTPDKHARGHAETRASEGATQ